MISAELTLGSSDHHEMVLVFPAHVANFTKCLIGTGKVPLFLGFMAISIKRFSSPKNYGGVWVLHPLMFITKRCSRPAIYYFSCPYLLPNRDHRSPMECHCGSLSRIFQVWKLISSHPVPQTSYQWLPEVSHSFTDLLHELLGHLLLVSIGPMWYPPPRRCSVKVFFEWMFWW